MDEGMDFAVLKKYDLNFWNNQFSAYCLSKYLSNKLLLKELLN